MTIGFTFGNYTTYRQRKYYRSWIEHTLFSATKLPTISSRDRLRILCFRDNMSPPVIEDPGRLPCADLQKTGKLSRFDDKLACLLVMMRHLTQTWWAYNKNDPGFVEPLLIELDNVIETWQQEEVIGNIRNGYQLKAVV